MVSMLWCNHESFYVIFILETFTSCRQNSIFYKVFSKALTFEVKAPANVVVGLSNNTQYGCTIWISIGEENDNSNIWVNYNCEKVVETKNILSENEYRKFWISWFNCHVKFGKYGDFKPLLSVECKQNDLKYITFGLTEGETRPAYWKFELPPIEFYNKLSIKPVKGGKPTWVKVGTQLADDAIVGGYENESLYIIRATHNDSLTPGKFVPSQGLGYIAWGGIAHVKRDIEVLCGYDFVWIKTTNNNIPVGAVVGGYSEVGHEALYVGRVMHKGHCILGKVQPSHSGCLFPFEGKEVGSQEYEILVSPVEFYRNNNRKSRCHFYAHNDHRSYQRIFGMSAMRQYRQYRQGGSPQFS